MSATSSIYIIASVNSPNLKCKKELLEEDKKWSEINEEKHIVRRKKRYIKIILFFKIENFFSDINFIKIKIDKINTIISGIKGPLIKAAGKIKINISNNLIFLKFKLSLRLFNIEFNSIL